MTLNPNGSGASVAPTKITVSAGGDYGDLPTPSRTGYTFLGWFTAASGGTQVYDYSALVSNSSHTLYAHWAQATYTVTLNANGGSVSPTKLNVTVGGTYGTLPTPSRTGYTFLGWYTAASGGTRVYGSDTYTTAGNQTLYAHWEQMIYNYSIVYESINGTRLGTASGNAAYGTTQLLIPESFSGYNTPGSQSVTILENNAEYVFQYTPSPVSKASKSGTLCTSPKVNYTFTVELQNRTATSVQVRVVWNTTLKANGWVAYGQKYSATIGGVDTGTVSLCNYGSDWKSAVSYDRTKTGTSGWVTVPLNTTGATSISMSYSYWQTNSNNVNVTALSSVNAYGEKGNLTIQIPAY